MDLTDFENAFDLSGMGLISDPAKILYFPTPKVACSSLKQLLAEAGGTLSTDRAVQVFSPYISDEMTIHDPLVSGLNPFRKTSTEIKTAALSSKDWWRVGALRDPYARVYSSWDNRVLFLPDRMPLGSEEFMTDVLEDGAMNVNETFRIFLKGFLKNPSLVMKNIHFIPQFNFIRPDLVPYTHMFRIDEHGAFDNFASELSTRMNLNVSPRRMNEGTGIKADQIVDAEMAAMIEEIFAIDFEKLGFPKRTFPDKQETVYLSKESVRILQFARNISPRFKHFGLSLKQNRRRINRLEARIAEQASEIRALKNKLNL